MSSTPDDTSPSSPPAEGPISEEQFEPLADETMRQLLEAIIACSDDLDPDLQAGVLSIQFEDDSKYVVNSHRAARQIWMAAERSAWHFDPRGGRWLTRGGEELWATVSAVIGRKLGETVELKPSDGA